MARKLTEEDKGVLKMARAMEPFLRSEGWHYYTQVMEAHKKQHLGAILAATADLKGVLAGERDKGALVALNLASDWPKTLIEQAAQIRKEVGEDPDGED